MVTKLTLTLDRDTIKKAKAYAALRKQSLSRITEEYFKNLTDRPDSQPKSTNTPHMSVISGMFKDDYKNQNLDDLLFDALKEKYL